ncbi:MAG: carbohydrate ABC transporter permease, partial [Alphaproteobacteria bacterium]|nr:carbohydrate ABC transporter permease [Alphaproteobacteria bacterium]
MTQARTPFPFIRSLENTGAWFLAILWLSPLIYAFWSAFHPAEYATRFDIMAPLTLENFRIAWDQAPFAQYFLNTFILVSTILFAQLVLCTLAAFAFARIEFHGKSIAFVFVLMQ